MRATMLAVVLAFAATAALAGEKAACGQGHKGGGEHALWKQLGLTEEQKTSLKTLREEQMAEVRDIGKQLRDVRKAVKEELLKDSPSSAVLSRAAADAGDLTEKLTESFIDHLLEVKKVLTPEQFAQVLEKTAMLRMGAASCSKAEMACKKGQGKPGCAKECSKGKKQGECPRKKGNDAE